MRKTNICFITSILFCMLSTVAWGQTSIIRRIPVNIQSQKSSSLALKIASCQYQTYSNNDYGYSFDYPNFLEQYKDDDEFNDQKGVVLSWANQVAINSWVDEASGDTPQTLWNALKSNKEIRYTYHRIIGNTLFSSGFLPNGNILYDKWIFKNNFIYSVSLEYPAGNKKDMDAMVEKVTRSFKVK